MKHNANPLKFVIYKLITEKRVYVAIPKEYVIEIENEIRFFHGINRVPNDKTVRGIFLKKISTDVYELDENAQQNDITINQLRRENQLYNLV
jgi:hypothetical protein